MFPVFQTEVTSSHEKVELRIVESPVSHSATVGSETAALVTGTAIDVASATAVATAATTTSKAKSPIAKKPVAYTAAKKMMPAPAKPAPKAPAKKLEPRTRQGIHSCRSNFVYIKYFFYCSRALITDQGVETLLITL